MNLSLNTASHLRAGHRFTAVALSLMAVLQMLLFMFTGTLVSRAVGIVLGCAVLASAAGIGKKHLSPLVLWILTGAIIVNLGCYVGTAQAVTHRLLQDGVVLGYSAVLTAALLALIVRIRMENTLLLSLTFALSAWGLEAMIPFAQGIGARGVRWVGGTVPHPELGEYNPPNGSAQTIYPDNPRHYFEEPDQLARNWILDIHDPGSAATLALLKDVHHTLKVDVTRADTSVPWHVQLREPQLALKKTQYELRFQARAAKTRKIAYGVGQAHAPWNGLGLYQEAYLGPEWREFKSDFVPSSPDDNAQVHFDLGGPAVSVEFDDIVLRRVSDGAVVAPPAPKEYSVTYLFNSQGCRGNDYAIPKPAGHRRIVALGDSFTLGVGVHQADTFEAQLEKLLNAEPGTKSKRLAYDVINCGVSGYATKDERLFYELIASRYQPDVVLLMMVFNDDRSWRDDVRLGYYHQPTELENQFAVLRVFQTARHEGRRPDPDFTPNIGEILKLDEECRRNNSRLAVAFFRNGGFDSAWTKLITTVSGGLQGKGIPMIDLGEELMRTHSFAELLVHPLYDGHPNEIAHANAAQQLQRFLRREGLID